MQDVCYICGNEIGDAKRSRDHVPPKQFYPSALVKADVVKNLLTLEAHASCNSSFQRDEDYFFTTLSIFASREMEVGKLVWQDLKKKAQRGQSRRLYEMVRQEFAHITPGGIHIPFPHVLKEYDSARVMRVACKIVRGLYFKHFKSWIPDDADWYFVLVDPGSPPPDIFGAVAGSPSQGDYPGIFDYKFTHNEVEGWGLWAMLLWDALIIMVGIVLPGYEDDIVESQ